MSHIQGDCIFIPRLSGAAPQKPAEKSSSSLPRKSSLHGAGKKVKDEVPAVYGYIYTEPEATFERAGAQSPNSILTSEKRERGIGVEEIEAFRARVVVVVANYGSSYIYVNGIRVYVYAAR